MDPAVVDAFNFTQYQRGRVAYEKPRKSRAEKLHERRVAQLQEKLRDTKQNVVKHVIQARILQRTLEQAEVVNRSLHNHLSTVINGKPSRQLGLKIIWLEEKTDLALIESAIKAQRGNAARLQQALNGYNDDKLTTELTAIPKINGMALNAALYCRVVLASSAGALNAHDALHMYRLSEEVKLPLKTRWDILINMLRKRMLIVHLALSIVDLPPINESNLIIAVQPRTIYSTSMDDSELSYRHHSQPTARSEITQKSLYSKTSFALPVPKDTKKPSKKKLLQTSGTGAAGGVSILQGELQKSKARLAGLSERVISDISSISKTVSIVAAQDSTAVQFAKRVGCRRMEDVFVEVFLRATKEAMRRWKNAIRMLNAEHTSRGFLRSIAVVRFGRAIESATEGKLARYMRRVIAFCERMSANESYAALIEIQRFWRGAVHRVWVTRLRRGIAATHIQRVCRGHLSKSVIFDKRRIRDQYDAVAKIKKIWKHKKWIRVMRKALRLRLHERMALQIQRVYRGHCRRNIFRALVKAKTEQLAAIKIQSVRRMYAAILRVDKFRSQKQFIYAATRIQRRIRGMIARIEYQDRKERAAAATQIKYAWYCCKARAEVSRKRRWRASIQCQRVFRGHLGRLRFKMLDDLRHNFRQQEQLALLVIRNFVMFYRVRMKYIRIIDAYTARRRAAATTINRILVAFKLAAIARKRVAVFREAKRKEEERILLARKRELLRIRCAMLVQRVFRGSLGRTRAAERRREREIELIREQERSKAPMYYRMKDEYFKNQNLFHRRYAIIAQSAWRGYKGRQYAKIVRRHYIVTKIKRGWKRSKAVRDAIAELKDLRKQWRIKNVLVVLFQKLVRGFLARREYRRHNSSDIVRWLLMQLRAQGLTGRALVNFRLRKLAMERANKASIKIQALIRRFLTRCKFHKSYKRLIRERAQRIKNKRDKAATKIQSIFRLVLAKKTVIARKQQHQEEKRTEELLEQLESMLENVHSSFLTELMALRAQTGARALLAKKQFLKKSAEYVKEIEAKEKRHFDACATKIQARIRGIRGRKKFKKMLPQLRKEAQQRSFCVECEDTPATKRCVDCKDRYCESCFTNIHSKGARKKHSWQPITITSRTNGRRNKSAGRSGRTNDNDVSFQSTGGATASASSAKQPQKPVFNKADWEEFYDPSAKAKYWYNNKTGEASWINPFK